MGPVSALKCLQSYGRHSEALDRLPSPADGRLGPMAELQYSYGTVVGRVRTSCLIGFTERPECFPASNSSLTHALATFFLLGLDW